MGRLLTHYTRSQLVDRYTLCASPNNNPIDVLFITGPDSKVSHGPTPSLQVCVRECRVQSLPKVIVIVFVLFA